MGKQITNDLFASYDILKEEFISLECTPCMNPQLVIDIPFENDAPLSSRSRKYVTCLQMVHTIIHREISEEISIDLFNQLGIVAGFIDQHLDDLELGQQRELLVLYDALFDRIWDIEHYLIFRNEICQFVEQQKFVFSCEAIHLKDLFLFIQHCKAKEIKSEVSIFGKTIIAIAIQKQEATESSKLIGLLRNEGQAVVSLLRSLLYRDYSHEETFESTLLFLQDLEHILNVADDTLDTTADKRKNLISSNLGPFHRWKMLKHLTIQMMKTIKKYPLKTVQYGPSLTWYYFRKTMW